jgi:DivIVA domain-containing protein
MDPSQSALDSLRTVEFRETLKGYHRDDVDEYLEKAAVEAEALQEQLRQSGERLRQAAERISQLETSLEEKPPAPPAAPAEPVVNDDTLQRTLVLAQKFVDETRADAEAQAAKMVADAESRARQMTDDAQSRASQIAAESEQRLREDITRLESSRTSLSRDVEAMARHLEGERTRLRSALGDMLRWVEENVHPVAVDAAPAPDTAPRPTDDAPVRSASPAPNESTNGEGNRSAATQGAPAGPRGSENGPSGEVTQMRPTGAAARTGHTNTALPF